MLVNPKSGRGRAVRLADRFEAVLASEGFGVKRLAAIRGVDAEAGEPFDPARFAGADALVVFGGDGTLSRVAGLASQTETPVYHVPVGNENLFARQFGMSRDPGALAVALRRRDVALTDLAGATQGEAEFRFLIMASAGPDAGVVHRLADQRTKAIGHAAYAQPVVDELVRPSIPRLTIDVDGQRIVSDVTGWVVVANARPYGTGVDFARHASSVSAKLDVLFMPCTTSAQATSWILRARVGWHLRDKRLVYRSGTSIAVTVHGKKSVWQADGEALPMNGAREIRLGVQPRALPVIRP